MSSRLAVANDSLGTYDTDTTAVPDARPARATDIASLIEMTTETAAMFTERLERLLRVAQETRRALTGVASVPPAKAGGDASNLVDAMARIGDVICDLEAIFANVVP